jgi:hypothetical protein
MNSPRLRLVRRPSFPKGYNNIFSRFTFQDAQINGFGLIDIYYNESQKISETAQEHLAIKDTETKRLEAGILSAIPGYTERR